MEVSMVSIAFTVSVVSGLIAIIALILIFIHKGKIWKRIQDIEVQLEDILFTTKELNANISKIAKMVDNITSNGSALAKKNARNIEAIKEFIDGEFKSWVGDELMLLRKRNETLVKELKVVEKDANDRLSDIELIISKREGVEERLNKKLNKSLKDIEDRFLTTYGAGLKKLAESLKKLEEKFTEDMSKKLELLKDFIREKRKSGEI